MVHLENPTKGETMAETPTFIAASCVSRTASLDELMGGLGRSSSLGVLLGDKGVRGERGPQGPIGKQMEQDMSNRIVQVFIADINPNIPVEERLLYKGEPKFTDMTDQELFFELDIKELLAKHNEKRIKIIDKSVKDRTQYLEPARVRDLKMATVTITAFQ